MASIARVSGDRVSSDRTDAAPLAWLLAGLNAAAAVIHFAMVPIHSGDGSLDPLGFALAGWFQLVVAVVLIIRRPGPTVYAASVAINLALIGLWVWSRTAGLPFGSSDGIAEEAAAVDLTAVSLEAGAVVLGLALLLMPALRLPPLAAITGGLGALALATVAITGQDAASHGGATHVAGDQVAAGSEGSGGHAHGGGSADMSETAGAASGDHNAEMVRIDRARCDSGFNPEAYWTETQAMAIDTYAGGAMAMTDHGGGTVGDVARPTAFGGRGSVHFDRLVSLTSQSGGELAAATLVTELADATDAEYDAWRNWMVVNPQDSHGSGDAGHGDTASSGLPTMGHVGPQPWKAIVDPSTCQALSRELELARETALRYPTVADVEEAGWTRVTPYVPGIAAHYMNFGIVDEKFEITKPEMILYDGTEPDSTVIGLSYYIRLDGTAEPTQGFSGDSDRYHRHLGLCVGAGGVIGDSTTTDAECAARGGTKASGTDGWMSHAWVVPGCESPWGVFSAVNPLLDGELGAQTTEDGGGCAGSSVRDRYELSPGRSDLTSGDPADGVASGE